MGRVYYRSYDAEVTSDVFISDPGGEPRTYAIAEIGRVAVKTVPRGWWEVWRRKETYLLEAEFRGGTVTLYRSEEPRVFNMVSRALRRALEERPGRHWA
ncbi:DUF6232 family protein [Actinoplanes sp. NEAU-A12]|uniref:DUF6232 family protein n=1 Tax=Actinoplanes sandaracinus TaxID=3045177 RepID=A0ABT6WYB7_9ACTN|nr:DUF6232 family protein [Actinoplanes sandaracinus]MDI6104743.1 DUF6232 family protein [Actinoplanes sandaracinus]